MPPSVPPPQPLEQQAFVEALRRFALQCAARDDLIATGARLQEEFQKIIAAVWRRMPVEVRSSERCECEQVVVGRITANVLAVHEPTAQQLAELMARLHALYSEHLPDTTFEIDCLEDALCASAHGMLAQPARSPARRQALSFLATVLTSVLAGQTGVALCADSRTLLEEMAAASLSALRDESADAESAAAPAAAAAAIEADMADLGLTTSSTSSSSGSATGDGDGDATSTRALQRLLRERVELLAGVSWASELMSATTVDLGDASWVENVCQRAASLDAAVLLLRRAPWLEQLERWRADAVDRVLLPLQQLVARFAAAAPVSALADAAALIMFLGVSANLLIPSMGVLTRSAWPCRLVAGVLLHPAMSAIAEQARSNPQLVSMILSETLMVFNKDFGVLLARSLPERVAAYAKFFQMLVQAHPLLQALFAARPRLFSPAHGELTIVASLVELALLTLPDERRTDAASQQILDLAAPEPAAPRSSTPPPALLAVLECLVLTTMSDAVERAMGSFSAAVSVASAAALVHACARHHRSLAPLLSTLAAHADHINEQRVRAFVVETLLPRAAQLSLGEDAVCAFAALAFGDAGLQPDNLVARVLDANEPSAGRPRALAAIVPPLFNALLLARSSPRAEALLLACLPRLYAMGAADDQAVRIASRHISHASLVEFVRTAARETSRFAFEIHHVRALLFLELSQSSTPFELDDSTVTQLANRAAETAIRLSAIDRHTAIPWLGATACLPKLTEARTGELASLIRAFENSHGSGATRALGFETVARVLERASRAATPELAREACFAAFGAFARTWCSAVRDWSAAPTQATLPLMRTLDELVFELFSLAVRGTLLMPGVIGSASEPPPPGRGVLAMFGQLRIVDAFEAFCCSLSRQLLTRSSLPTLMQAEAFFVLYACFSDAAMMRDRLGTAGLATLCDCAMRMGVQPVALLLWQRAAHHAARFGDTELTDQLRTSCMIYFQRIEPLLVRANAPQSVLRVYKALDAWDVGQLPHGGAFIQDSDLLAYILAPYPPQPAMPTVLRRVVAEAAQSAAARTAASSAAAAAAAGDSVPEPYEGDAGRHALADVALRAAPAAASESAATLSGLAKRFASRTASAETASLAGQMRDAIIGVVGQDGVRTGLAVIANMFQTMSQMTATRLRAQELDREFQSLLRGQYAPRQARAIRRFTCGVCERELEIPFRIQHTEEPRALNNDAIGANRSHVAEQSRVLSDQLASLRKSALVVQHLVGLVLDVDAPGDLRARLIAFMIGALINNATHAAPSSALASVTRMYALWLSRLGEAWAQGASAPARFDAALPRVLVETERQSGIASLAANTSTDWLRLLGAVAACLPASELEASEDTSTRLLGAVRALGDAGLPDAYTRLVATRIAAGPIFGSSGSASAAQLERAWDTLKAALPMASLAPIAMQLVEFLCRASLDNLLRVVGHLLEEARAGRDLMPLESLLPESQLDRLSQSQLARLVSLCGEAIAVLPTARLPALAAMFSAVWRHVTVTPSSARAIWPGWAKAFAAVFESAHAQLSRHSAFDTFDLCNALIEQCRALCFAAPELLPEALHLFFSSVARLLPMLDEEHGIVLVDQFCELPWQQFLLDPPSDDEVAQSRRDLQPDELRAMRALGNHVWYRMAHMLVLRVFEKAQWRRLIEQFTAEFGALFLRLFVQASLFAEYTVPPELQALLDDDVASQIGLHAIPDALMSTVFDGQMLARPLGCPWLSVDPATKIVATCCTLARFVDRIGGYSAVSLCRELESAMFVYCHVRGEQPRYWSLSEAQHLTLLKDVFLPLTQLFCHKPQFGGPLLMLLFDCVSNMPVHELETPRNVPPAFARSRTTPFMLVADQMQEFREKARTLLFRFCTSATPSLALEILNCAANGINDQDVLAEVLEECTRAYFNSTIVECAEYLDTFDSIVVDLDQPSPQVGARRGARASGSAPRSPAGATTGARPSTLSDDAHGDDEFMDGDDVDDSLVAPLVGQAVPLRVIGDASAASVAGADTATSASARASTDVAVDQQSPLSRHLTAAEASLSVLDPNALLATCNKRGFGLTVALVLRKRLRSLRAARDTEFRAFALLAGETLLAFQPNSRRPFDLIPVLTAFFLVFRDPRFYLGAPELRKLFKRVRSALLVRATSTSSSADPALELMYRAALLYLNVLAENKEETEIDVELSELVSSQAVLDALLALAAQATSDAHQQFFDEIESIAGASAPFERFTLVLVNALFPIAPYLKGFAPAAVAPARPAASEGAPAP